MKIAETALAFFAATSIIIGGWLLWKDRIPVQKPQPKPGGGRGR